MRAAERLSDFQELTICPLRSRPVKESRNNKDKHSKPRWTLGQTFASLSEPLEETNIKVLFGQKWSKHKLTAEFDKVQAKSPQIHAEVQLMLYAAQQNARRGQHSEYIGCSKRSCLLCSKFLRAYGSFRTRPSHGKIFGPWTIPETDCLSGEDLDTLASAVKTLEEFLKDSLKKSKAQKVPPQAKESTVGGPSKASRVDFHGSALGASLLLQHLAQQREQEHDRVVEGP